jgi:hypothetical protein
MPRSTWTTLVWSLLGGTFLDLSIPTRLKRHWNVLDTTSENPGVCWTQTWTHQLGILSLRRGMRNIFVVLSITHLPRRALEDHSYLFEHGCPFDPKRIGFFLHMND